MNTIKNYLLVLIVFVSCMSNSNAQKKKNPNFREGCIKYKVEVDGAEDVSQFINNSVLSLYIKNKNTKMDISIMGGLAHFQLIDNKKDDLFTLLMDVPSFYEKTAISIDENNEFFADINKAGLKNKSPEKQFSVKYFKSKKKKIANYSCYKAEVSIGGTENDKLILYLTDKLRPEVLSQIEKTIGDVEGFPLGFEMLVDGVRIKVTAVEVVKKSIQTDSFIIPLSYTQKSLDQFKNDIRDKLGEGSATIRL